LVNLSADGTTVKARWHGFFMLGGGDDARWEGGIFENEYVREDGAWKISRLHYYPQFAGPYESGWKNVGPTQPIFPYHFTPQETGVPIPPAEGPAPKTTATLSELERRIDALNAQDAVRNLQNAYGYYVDRKMWDDVTDLFTEDGVFEVGGVGVYEGSANIRRALERDGPAGLKHGELFEHPLFDTIVEISADGREAQLRGIELGMLGNANAGEAWWSVRVFGNRMVKGDDGKWRIREMRLFPTFKTDYYQGWGKSRIVDPRPPAQFAPNRAASSAGENVIPAFFLKNPATGQPVSYPPQAIVVAKDRLLAPASQQGVARPSGDFSARLAEARRRLGLSTAYHGMVNVAAAYSEYLDDSQFPEMGALFAEKGVKEVPYTGFYIGQERVSRRSSVIPVNERTSVSFHWLLQPVVDVAPDGRSAQVRTRMFQPRTTPDGNSANIGNGMDLQQAILENGVWKLWHVLVDQHHLSYGSYKGGWARLPPPQPRGIRAPGSGGNTNPFPPDIPETALGKRKEGFIGGIGTPVNWPGIMPMWFHYKNPVSGRVPELHWPICGTCEIAPETSMDRHGYMLPAEP